MTILFTRFPLESRFGGAEVQTLALMEGLRKKGHEVMFLGNCPTLLAACKQRTIDHWQLAIGYPPVTKWLAISFAWRQYWMRPVLIKAIQKLIAKCQMPNAIFMLSLTEKLLLTDWAIAQGIKVFWIEHDRVGRWLTHNPWLPTLRKLSRQVITIVVSDLSRDLYLKLGWDQERIATIPNGVDLHHFVPNPNPNPNLRRIGCIARLTRDKGVDLLIEAAQDLPNVTVDIVGTGKEEVYLRRMADRVNAQTHKRINVISSVPNIAAFYHSLDVFVLPSRSHDPFGLVVAEAMAAGVPVIVTDACGVASHLAPEEALIVKAGSVEALREALRMMQKDSIRQQFALSGPKVAREKFSLARMIEAYEKTLY